MATATDVPLIWTTKGNVPVDDLRYETAWLDEPAHVIFRERYFLADELVKENVHVLGRRGEAAGGVAGDLNGGRPTALNQTIYSH